MAAGSRLAAVAERLLTIIPEREALAGIQVEAGHPGQQLQRESIWLDELKFTEESAVLGKQPPPRRQDVTATFMVRVSQAGNDALALRIRGLLLADEVEEALRADPTLDGAVIHGGVTAGESDIFTDTDGRVCAVKVEATYRARKG